MSSAWLNKAFCNVAYVNCFPPFAEVGYHTTSSIATALRCPKQRDMDIKRRPRASSCAAIITSQPITMAESSAATVYAIASLARLNQTFSD